MFAKEKKKGSPILLSRIMDRLAKASGLSKRSCERIMSGYQVFVSVKEPETKAKKVFNNVGIEYYKWVPDTVHEMMLAKEDCSLDCCLEKLQQRNQWPFSRSNLRDFMGMIGFTFGEGPNHYDVAKRNIKIINQKRKYIEDLRRLRQEGYMEYVMDETFLHSKMQNKKMLQSPSRFPQGNPMQTPNKSKGSRPKYIFP
jgi:hypothetical protein